MLGHLRKTLRTLKQRGCVQSIAMAGVLFFATAAISVAQGPPGHDRHDHYDSHGHNDRHDDWRFRDQDRNQFYSHYRHDADRWRGRNRPHFVRGQVIPRGYAIRPVPQAYWRSMPPPPPGYQYGYYDGYVMAYNPTTRIVADVLDLVTAAATR